MLIYTEKNNIIQVLEKFYNEKNYKGFFEYVKGDIGLFLTSLYKNNNNEYYILLKEIWENEFKNKTKIYKTLENLLILVDDFDLNKNKILGMEKLPIKEIVSKFFLDSIILGVVNDKKIINEIYVEYLKQNKFYFKTYQNLPIEAYLLTQVNLIKNGFKLTNTYDLLENNKLKIDRVYVKEKVKVYFEEGKDKLQITTISNDEIFKPNILENIKELSDLKSKDIVYFKNDYEKKYVIGDYNLDSNNFSLERISIFVPSTNDKIFSTIYNDSYIKEDLYDIDLYIKYCIENGIEEISKKAQEDIKNIYLLYNEKINELCDFISKFNKNSDGYWFYNNKSFGDDEKYKNLYDSLLVFKDKMEDKIKIIYSNTNISDWENNNFSKEFNIKIKINKYKIK